MERKLATALFVDLVDSTALVAASDPEVARRQVTGFFDRVRGAHRRYGGHGREVRRRRRPRRLRRPDRARGRRRAGRARGRRDRRDRQTTSCPCGSGSRRARSSSRTATRPSPRVRRSTSPPASSSRAEPGEILIGPTAYGLTTDRVVTRAAPSARPLKGLRDGDAGAAGRLHRAADRTAAQRGRAVRRAGGGARAARQRVRPGRARPAGPARDDLRRPGHRQEPARAGVLRGPRAHDRPHRAVAARSARASPTGRSPRWSRRRRGSPPTTRPRRRFEKLREACSSDAVADLLGLAVRRARQRLGRRAAGRRSPGRRTSGRRPSPRRSRSCSGFEDVHWAEEPLLDLVEHLADRIDDAPVLIVCLARPELLDVAAGLGGGTAAVDHDRARPAAPRPTSRPSSTRSSRAPPLPRGVRAALLDKTEGNPLFVEETVRMLAEQGDGAASVRIPDTVQALIAARIDRLPPASRSVAASRRPRRPRVLARRGRRARPGARRRHRARRSRRPPAAAPASRSRPSRARSRSASGTC